MSKKSPEKGPICLSSPEVHKCDFELCTDALVCMKRIGKVEARLRARKGVTLETGRTGSDLKMGLVMGGGGK